MRKILFLLIAMTMISACQRKTEESTSLSILLPGAMDGISQSVSATDLVHVVINVSGPGFPTVVFNWDKKGAFGTNLTPPSQFTLDVPSASSALVQLIAVYEDSSNKSLSFYYGDVSQSLSGSEMSVPITVSLMGGSSGEEGEVQGRYLSTASGGPTGRLLMMIRPSNGSPPMVIQESSIVNGWFNVFALSGQAFDYVVNGASLFGGPKSLGDFRAMASNSVLVTKMPGYYRDQSSIAVFEKPRDQIRGFFGPGVGAQSVCYSTTSSSLSGYFADASLSTGSLISYTGSSSVNTSAVYMQGGIAGTTPCTGTAYVNYMKVDPAYQGWDRQIRIPLLPSYNFSLSASASFSNLSVLPGLETLSSSYSIYGLSPLAISSLKMDDHEGIDCVKLKSSMVNHPNDIVLGGTLTSATLGSGISFSISGMPSSARYVFCPDSTNSDFPLPGVTLN